MHRLRLRRRDNNTSAEHSLHHPQFTNTTNNTTHPTRRRQQRWRTTLLALVAVLLVLLLWHHDPPNSNHNYTGHHHNSDEKKTSSIGLVSENSSLHHHRTTFVEWPDYCSTTHLNWTQFWNESGPLLHQTLREYQHEQQQKQQHSKHSTTTNIDSTSVIYQEFFGQLLEQYLQRNNDKDDNAYCNYSHYRPTVPSHAAPALSWSSSSCRIVAIISAFRDAPHLTQLLQALQHEQICIVLHVDDSVFRATLQTTLDELLLLHSNQSIVVLQFGAVLYRTDSLSMINLRILRWLTESPNDLHYDYVMLLDGSAYPLVSPTELVQRLLLLNNNNTQQQQQRHVYLGALTHQGQNVTGMVNAQVRWQRWRLLDPVTKWHRRLPRLHPAPKDLPQHLSQHLIYKSTSGNQAVYSRTVVQALLNSNSVMELFARAKYGCCCCIEEHSWMAALSMIGYADEALSEEPFMFQSWGGGSHKCVGTMNNAVLSRNDSLCFRTETGDDELYYHGNETWDRLQMARARGVLMARKFQSSRADSVQLREDIRTMLWDSAL